MQNHHNHAGIDRWSFQEVERQRETFLPTASASQEATHLVLGVAHADWQLLSRLVLRSGITVLQCARQYLRLLFYISSLIFVVDYLNPTDREAPQDTEKLECV